MVEPTIEAIVDAARKLSAVAGTRKEFFLAFSRKASPSDREVRAAWFAMRAYVENLAGMGVDYETLVPPKDLDGSTGIKAPVEAVLEASMNSIILVRNWTDEQVKTLRSWLGFTGLWGAILVSLKDGQSLEMLSEEDMKKAGWIRSSKAGKSGGRRR